MGHICAGRRRDGSTVARGTAALSVTRSPSAAPAGFVEQAVAAAVCMVSLMSVCTTRPLSPTLRAKARDGVTGTHQRIEHAGVACFARLGHRHRGRPSGAVQAGRDSSRRGLTRPNRARRARGLLRLVDGLRIRNECRPSRLSRGRFPAWWPQDDAAGAATGVAVDAGLRRRADREAACCAPGGRGPRNRCLSVAVEARLHGGGAHRPGGQHDRRCRSAAPPGRPWPATGRRRQTRSSSNRMRKVFPSENPPRARATARAR